MSPLDADDIEILVLALDLLGHHANRELAKTRRNDSAKKLAMIAICTRVAEVRVKVRAMQVAP